MGKRKAAKAPACGHLSLQSDCEECKQLKAFWEDKLEQSGVINIEQEDGNLKLWASHFFPAERRKRGMVSFEAKQEYYRMAGQFRFEHKFKSARDRLIWELHAEGETIQSIIKVLQAKGITAYSDLVHGTIKRLFKEMMRFYERQDTAD